ncbi:recombination-associated protein RdgC [Nitrincola iocasae]|uniref:Recombination-associated protein RdgC n=1 Tax=Nitrincola iocasae TaxID=2614693 RepID=A0A5J6LFQ3_9GAMM|nr:recombination-associated protein RdgC [Nitrincola iocasae]QEW07041.1 recombination-associated protein RdgC [Nitrincola iocasae]
MNSFKNLLCYRFEPDSTLSPEILEKALSEHPFTPCGRHELQRSGWVAPCPFADSLVFTSSGFMLITLLREERILPASVIRDEVQERVSRIEAADARKVYKKEKDQLKDEVVLELLPRAFSKRQSCRALLMPEQGWLLIDSGSFNRGELLLNALREALGSLKVKPLNVNQAPASVMTQWLQDIHQVSSGFEVDDECELRDTSAEGGVIRIKGQPLFSDEIRAHLDTDMQVTRLAVTWEEQLSFVLHADLTLHRLKLTDQYNEQLEHDRPEDEVADFDAAVTRMGLEMTRLLPALANSFGGEPVSD